MNFAALEGREEVATASLLFNFAVLPTMYGQRCDQRACEAFATPSLAHAYVRNAHCVPRCETVSSGTAKVRASSLQLSSRFVGRSRLAVSGTPHRGMSAKRVPRRTAVIASAAPALSPVERSVVWFRVGDLRTKDHVGLSQACSYTEESIFPLFVVTPETPASALRALERLRSELREMRTDLYVRFANSEAQGVLDFVSSHGGNRIHVRRDVDARALDDVRWLETSFQKAHGSVSISSWRDELHDLPRDQLIYAPSSYPEFVKWRPDALAELTPDAVVCSPPKEDAEGAKAGPDSGSIGAMVTEVEASSRRTFVDAIESRYNEDSARLGVEPIGENVSDPEGVVYSVLERLEAYESLDIGRALQDVFWLGLLSPRQVRDICIAFEREHGRLWSPIYRLGAKTILRYLDAREFADCSAERDLASDRVMLGNHRPKFYRWRGIIARYVEAGESVASREKPAVCLIHGFGASAQHWERSIALLDTQYHCFAFCNVGFGRTEKPPFVYTQHLWELFQASFVRDVVKRKTFVAGNSIGGYLAAAFACDSDWCAGAALVNSAGTLYSPDEYAKQLAMEADSAASNPKRGILQALLQGSRPLRFAACNLLLLYLRRGIGGTLQRVYPTSPDGWTEALELEIRRNSQDYGAVDVLASGFILPKQRPLNELLADGPPVLVFQGALDPLGSGNRAANLKKVIPEGRAYVEVIQAGHCPHDECPEKFSTTFSEWMEKVSVPALTM